MKGVKTGLFADIAGAARAFQVIRKAHKEGNSVAVQVTKPIPCFRLPPAFLNTVEGYTLYNLGRSIGGPAKAAFDALPYDVKRKLEFAPKTGEFAERAEFWRGVLEPVLEPKQRQEATIAILRWFQHVKRMSGGETA